MFNPGTGRELKEITLGIKYPVCMAKLPLLHPRTATSILKCGMEEPKFLPVVEKMIVNSPHELAFRSVSLRSRNWLSFC